MARDLTRCLLLLLLIALASSAQAQDEGTLDDFTRTFYAGLEQSTEREYNAALSAMLARYGASGEARLNSRRRDLKLLYYNKSTVFASCTAEAEKARAPGAPRIRAEANIVLTTCVEVKFGEMSDFSNKLSYARVFFPERIKKCGEASRLRDREKLLPPYSFLQLPDPKLYDFARYSQCLMTRE